MFVSGSVCLLLGGFCLCCSPIGFVIYYAWCWFPIMCFWHLLFAGVFWVFVAF